MNELKVTVTGRPHCGKTTLARRLAKFMEQELGYQVNVICDEGTYLPLAEALDIPDVPLAPIRIRVETQEGYPG